MANLTEGENYLCKQQLGYNGGFYTDLIRVIQRADDGNAARLALGFPSLVEAVKRFQHEEGYWQDLARRWNEENPRNIIIP